MFHVIVEAHNFLILCVFKVYLFPAAVGFVGTCEVLKLSRCPRIVEGTDIGLRAVLVLEAAVTRLHVLCQAEVPSLVDAFCFAPVGSS